MIEEWIVIEKQFYMEVKPGDQNPSNQLNGLGINNNPIKWTLSNFYLFYFSQRTEEISHRNHNVAWGGIFPGKPRELYAIAAGINNSLTPFCRTPTNPKSQP